MKRAVGLLSHLVSSKSVISRGKLSVTRLSSEHISLATCSASSMKPSAASKPTYVLEPSGKHTSTLIWMHGLGDSHEGFADLFQQTKPLLPSGLRVILPDAPERPVTINQGMIMRGWYDIASFERSKIGLADGVEESFQFINNLIDAETKLVPASKIIIGGFSQGGAMAMFVGFQYKERLAAILASSAYVLTPLLEGAVIPDRNKDIPFLVFHGESDSVVNYRYAMESYKLLAEKHGISNDEVMTNKYQDHGIDMKQWAHMIKRINEILE
eukprot:TRINITY_DN6752_c0_g1_i1.p1 TRINITY_DN6752_c0_g1~~TRINITY_DN6752_c0_g1_i1.p1  ORF type:complete len:270 (-),score=21.19 TRINITY_DN6752_c0_g1_i1:8-817(-)